jgi:hypothetical protein
MLDISNGMVSPLKPKKAAGKLVRFLSAGVGIVCGIVLIAGVLFLLAAGAGLLRVSSFSDSLERASHLGETGRD